MHCHKFFLVQNPAVCTCVRYFSYCTFMWANNVLILVYNLYYSVYTCTVAGPFLIGCGPAAQCPTTTTQVSPTVTPIKCWFYCRHSDSYCNHLRFYCRHSSSYCNHPRFYCQHPTLHFNNPASFCNTRNKDTLSPCQARTQVTWSKKKKECEATKFSIVPIEGSHPHEFMLSASQEKIPYYSGP